MRSSIMAISLGATLVFLCHSARAGCPITYTFQGGATIVASQVNQDVNDLINCTNTLGGSGAILPNGYVGIGVTTPSTMLDIAQNNAIQVGNAYLSSGGDFAHLANNEWYDGANWTATAPGALIQLNGQIVAFFTHDASGNHTMTMQIQPNGSVGIGTENPSSLLQVAGVVTATNFVSSSDERLKQDIVKLDLNATEIVAQLKPVTFKWKPSSPPTINSQSGQGTSVMSPVATPPNSLPGTRQLGFIAQDVQKLVPEAVVTGKDKDQTLGLQYNALIPILTKALQEQQAEIAQLKTEMQTVQTANRDLRQSIDQLQGSPSGKTK